MKTVKLSDYAEDIEDAMVRYEDACCIHTSEGLLEFSINYSEEQVAVYTGVDFLGDRESYLRPKSIDVNEINLYCENGEILQPEIIRDHKFDAEKIY